eukprot:TRINITY_DN111447_c0_g1_i1.p1 TRINITY_DN111447_c0_g1~~TRINITY_DN111447_c0_g1_i1.p1  ORF type:complete len:367 (+),score=34.81 TRINITY_DN111447_c0_g1_i1:141-1241(+)
MAPSLRYFFCVLWAALIGVSVPLEMVNTIFLNKNSPDKSHHAFYVSTLAVFMGGVELMPLALKAPKPWGKPSRWWHLLGGFCSLPAFVTIPAGTLLGSQLVLVTQLAALLATFLLMDLIDGKVKLTNYMRLVGFCLVLGGVALDNIGLKVGKASSLKAVVMLAAVALSGVSYALQARFNGRLAEDVGSSARATCVSAMVCVFLSLPVVAWIRFDIGVAVELDTRFWPLWVVAGFQSAFYIGSMAKLPRLLGFTTCYTITLGAKLATSLMVDSLGFTGTRIPVTFLRVASLACVLVGAVIFNSFKAGDTFQELREDHCEEEDAPVPLSVGGSFADVLGNTGAGSCRVVKVQDEGLPDVPPAAAPPAG